MLHISVSKHTIIGSDNGLSPGRRQAIIWTNAEILFIWPLGTSQWNINRNSYIFIQENALECVVCEMSAILSRPQCVKDGHQACGPSNGLLYLWFVLFCACFGTGCSNSFKSVSFHYYNVQFLTHCPLRDLQVILQVYFSKSFCKLTIFSSSCEIGS